MMDWIISLDGTHGRDAYMLRCERCGGTFRQTPPIPVSKYVANVWAFTEQHRSCKAEATEGGDGLAEWSRGINRPAQTRNTGSVASERDRIRAMVAAGNHGHAIMALMELIEATESRCRERRVKYITEAMKIGPITGNSMA